MRKFVLVLAAAALASCSSVEDKLEGFKLPRQDVDRVQRALNVAVASTPDGDSDGTINGAEWVVFVQAAIAEYEK
jgi:uncharacterized lipoprotein YmbA